MAQSRLQIRTQCSVQVVKIQIFINKIQKFINKARISNSDLDNLSYYLTQQCEKKYENIMSHIIK